MALDDEIDLFASIPFFEGFQTEQLRLLAFGAEKRALNRGDILYREGDTADCGYIIKRGQIVELAPGQEKSAEAVEGSNVAHDRGALIEPMALFSNLKRSHTAICSEPADLLRISRLLFTRMLQEYPDLAVLLRDRVGRDLVQFVGKLDRVLDRLDAIED